MGKNERQSRSYSIDIDKFEEILVPTSDCCIYRVPQFLRKINEDAYTPKLISIGPLHYNTREDLMGMENQKRRYLHEFCGRKGVGVRKLEDFKTYLFSQEENIRNHYAVSTPKFVGSDYVHMVLRDAVFIIELFMRNQEEVDDFLLDKSQLRTYITQDLLLLENQLPYFVLDHIYSSAISIELSFFDLCNYFFYPLFIFDWRSPFSEQPQVKHFTDLLRFVVLKVQEAEKPKNNREILVLRPSFTKQSNNGDQIPSATKQGIVDLPNATKLNESGLKFKTVDGKATYSLDIKLRKRKCGKRLLWLEETEVEIPCIKIYDDTECLFRNMMALELFHYPTKTYVCNYAVLMDYLIDTNKDVDLLIGKGIVANCLGENEKIAKMFNSLCSCIITPSPSCYDEITRHMKAHYDNSWNHAMATLRSVYFTNLWTGTATIAAVVLLVLTVIQTVCSVMQVGQGN